MSDDLAGNLLVLGAWTCAVWCLGGLHGLWLARTQWARMQRWADKIVSANESSTLEGETS